MGRLVEMAKEYKAMVGSGYGDGGVGGAALGEPVEEEKGKARAVRALNAIHRFDRIRDLISHEGIRQTVWRTCGFGVDVVEVKWQESFDNDTGDLKLSVLVNVAYGETIGQFFGNCYTAYYDSEWDVDRVAYQLLGQMVEQMVTWVLPLVEARGAKENDAALRDWLLDGDNG